MARTGATNNTKQDKTAYSVELLYRRTPACDRIQIKIGKLCAFAENLLHCRGSRAQLRAKTALKQNKTVESGIHRSGLSQSKTWR